MNEVDQVPVEPEVEGRFYAYKFQEFDRRSPDPRLTWVSAVVYASSLDKAADRVLERLLMRGTDRRVKTSISKGSYLINTGVGDDGKTEVWKNLPPRLKNQPRGALP